MLIVEGKVGMEKRRSRSRPLYLIAAGLFVCAVALVYITAPDPTVLVVQVVDQESEQPLAGASVRLQVPGEKPLPVLVTDETGQAWFQSLPPHPGYVLRAQLLDYALTVESPVAVPEEQQTTITVTVAHDPGQRLYVGLDRARVSIVDTASMLIVQTVVLPGASEAPEAPVRHLQLHPAGQLLYAVSGDQGLILASQTGASLGRLEVGGSIDGIELTADGRYVLAAGLAEGDPTGVMAQRRLWVLDAWTGQVVSDTLLSAVGAGSGLATAWQADGQDAYILRATNESVDRLATYGRGGLPFSGVPLGTTGRQQEVILSADGQYLYWWTAGRTPAQGDLTFLAGTMVEDSHIVFREAPAGVSAMAASPVREELYVLNGRLGTLTIIDGADGGSQTLVPAGKQPEHLVISQDGSRAYVADTEGDSILVVDLDSAAVVYVLPLPGEPISLATRQQVTME